MAEDWTEPLDSGPLPEDGSQFDVIVAGGGPGGAAAASYAALAGHRVLLLEKSVFPRDKTCGDAVGGKSLKHVAELGVKPMIEATPHFRVTGILFSSANGNEALIPLPEEEVENLEAGYSLPRLQFDYMMFKRARDLVLENDGAVIQDFTITEVNVSGEGEGDERRITGITGIIGGKRSGNEPMVFNAPLTIGASGYTCLVAKTITEVCYSEPMRDDVHYCGAYREYWTNVKGCEGSSGPIEIHFINEIIPGYFWIFPVKEGVVNVGIGMVVDEMNKQSVKLRKLQEWVIKEHPKFKLRFADSELVEGSCKGFQLPFGSPRKHPPSFQPRRSAMAGAICIGDAASLVDPFSGEGIGNALVTAKMAIKHFDAEKHGEGLPLSAANSYMDDLWDTLGPELTNSYKLQGLVRKKRVMNWFIGKAGRKPEIQRALTEMIASKEAQGQFHSKWWMFKTLVF